MFHGKVYIAGTSMITPLGEGVGKNFSAILRGESGVTGTTDPRITQSALTAGIIPEEVYINVRECLGARAKSLTRTEILTCGCLKSLIHSLPQELQTTLLNGRTGIVVATAKGNISALEGRCGSGPFIPSDDDKVLFSSMTRCISEFSGVRESDIRIISNACISGVSAIVAARRMLLVGDYDMVIVVGADTQNRFITSGFASFKSLSPELCRPYDESRCGLNLGEAAGAMALTSMPVRWSCGLDGESGYVTIDGGAVSDDANHISGPSRTGDGLFFAMRNAMKEAGVNAAGIDLLQMHGTATAYNDEMESKAACLAGVQDVPVQSLKPYFGHTMGASGVIETIIAAAEIQEGIIAGTKGYEKSGVSVPLNVSASNRLITKNLVMSNPAGKINHCLKTASGFGGTNAAVLLTSSPEAGPVPCLRDAQLRKMRKSATVEINAGEVLVNDSAVFSDKYADFGTFIREAFKSRGENNMKFYKLDDLCKLGYVAAAWLLDGIEFGEEECGMVLSGKYGCLDTDMKHQQIIDKEGDAASSPAVFVYTLPNVVAGEISIRHHIKGENTWFWSDDRTMSDLKHYASLMAGASDLRYCIIGHLDFLNGEYFAKFELWSVAG